MESVENINNEQIYESIAYCMRNSLPSSSQSDGFGNFEAQEQNTTNELRSTTACIGITMPSLSASTAKRAFKSGAEKFCGTVNTVRTKFGTLSQKLRKSTRRRSQLVNSPGTPVRTPRAALGRTPTKLYSPFSIETPRGKENSSASARRSLNRESFKKSTPPHKSSVFSMHRKAHMESRSALRSSPQLSNDMQQAQIGVYEFHHTADRIIRNFRH